VFIDVELRWVLGGAVHYELPMDSVLAGNRIVNPSGLDARVSGQTTFVGGPRDRGLMVDGRDSFIRVTGPGHRHECFGDLSNCPNGKHPRDQWLNYPNWGDGTSPTPLLYYSLPSHLEAFQLKTSSRSLGSVVSSISRVWHSPRAAEVHFGTV